ncbi:Zn-ribbon-containing, possibly RNA-binding protein and truncated derivatives [Serratia quinivorans]|jgi:hypothetical protein|uniref:DUF721 domain-containing protein n=3 Tax=Serratia TaxID=613 RepID=A0A2X2HJ29_9GAMM|nr:MULTISPECIES: DUF721 domain-containing protein [Serratia]MBV6694225.1 DUF721 domain-containing protein [Serratia quinivorans]MCS4266806.1 hypothetical protein [Serratia sp. BIGb0163]QBX66996.1 DUF721 domain-containing protein [Serratia quinivorans]QGH60573.1 DUF721 domain-containing protein [Serratia proteamaculans]RYM63659.1 hypothetical protein BSR03_05680 [Serratia proteamaculans]
MRDSRPQLLDSLFDDANTEDKGPLHNVQQRAVALLKLNRAVKGVLPVQLHPWCRVANFRQGILVLETANASWMMRLRYEQPALLSALRAQILPSLSSIDIRINPALMAKGSNLVQNAAKTAGNTQEKVPMRHLSQESAEELRGLASRSPEKLRKILERLASLAGEGANATSRDK